jgi:hypothetical protein
LDFKLRLPIPTRECHANKKSALKECKSFFAAEDGYKEHRVMTIADLGRESDRDDPPFGRENDREDPPFGVWAVHAKTAAIPMIS